jgi:hypothetical protein
VATHPYKIYYVDNYTQELPKVWKQRRDGIWLVFQDEDAEILRVQADKVFRVTRLDQPPDSQVGRPADGRGRACCRGFGRVVASGPVSVALAAHARLSETGD